MRGGDEVRDTVTKGMRAEHNQKWLRRISKMEALWSAIKEHTYQRCRSCKWGRMIRASPEPAGLAGPASPMQQGAKKVCKNEPSQMRFRVMHQKEMKSQKLRIA